MQRTPSKVVTGWLGPVLVMGLLGAASLGDFVAATLDPLRIEDDAAQQVAPFLRVFDPTLLRDDPVVDYCLDCLPVGYQALYRTTALIVDPRTVSKVLPWLNLAVFLVAVWGICRSLGSRWVGWLAVWLAVALGSPLDRMSGGLPRGFSDALVAIGIAALVGRRPVWLAVSAVLGAAFYPAAGVLLSIMLGLYLVVWPGVRNPETGARDWRRALVILTVTGVASLAVLVPPLTGSARWGGRVGPGGFDSYPEAGPEGRYRDEFLERVVPLPSASAESFERYLRSAGVPRKAAPEASWVLLWATVAAATLVAVRHRQARVLAPLLAATLGGYVASWCTYPLLFFPSRYLDLGLRPLLLVVVSLAAVEVVAWWQRSSRDDERVQRVACILALPLLMAVALFPGKRVGLKVDLAERQGLYRTISDLPADALIAGWPRGDLEYVRLVTGRRVLVEFETHFAFHAGIIELLRPRARLSIEAALAADDEALRRLRSEYGVTHFVLPVSFGGKGPRYFAPFEGVIRETLARRGARPAAVHQVAEQAVIYRDDRNLLIDLELATSAARQGFAGPCR